MSVIVELTLPADEFELGRILSVEDSVSIVLETMVPMGELPIPFVRLRDSVRSSFEEGVREHPAVTGFRVIESNEEETLYALEWTISQATFFDGIQATDAHLLRATGTADLWQFELRFPSHNALSEFQAHCIEADINVDVERIYNPTPPESGPWFGLTTAQREALTLAVEAGYYTIPRETSTQNLADRIGISDQAVTERLRRGINTLVTNTLHPDTEV